MLHKSSAILFLCDSSLTLQIKWLFTLIIPKCVCLSVYVQFSNVLRPQRGGGGGGGGGGGSGGGGSF